MVFEKSIVETAMPAAQIGAALLALGGCGETTPHHYKADAPIEYRYSQPGQYAERRIELSALEGQTQYAVYLPDDAGRPHPVVIWQNGTGVDIDTYDAIARHLASWGIVVLGHYDGQMGSGQAAITSLRHARQWADAPGHPLHARLDMDRVAMAGSSQGAVGTINAHTRFASGRALRTIAIHGTPSRQAIDFFQLELDYDASAITAPVFIMTGTEDSFISPVSLNQAIYDGLPKATPRALGVSTNADHIEFANDAGRMRGYLTAWLAFHLLGDHSAAQAFVGPAEITTNPDWSMAHVAY